MNHSHTLSSVARRGISLLEVLISAFVLSVGMLGLLSLVPLGGYRMGQVNQFDRAAATGRHAFREFKTRDMLEPNKWMAMDFANGTSNIMRTWRIPNPWDDGTATPRGGPEGPGVADSDIARRNVDDWADTFLIDPLYIARANDLATVPANWPGRTFPYDLQPTNSPALRTGNTITASHDNAPRMPRVTISMLENFAGDSSQTPPIPPVPTSPVVGMPNPPIANLMTSSVAERIFMSQNEGIYSLPTDESETPIRLYSGGNTIEQFEGSYSWMAMVSRAPHEVIAVESSAGSGIYYDISPAIRNEYQVSVIVFAKRNLDVDVTAGQTNPSDALASERVCGIEFVNGIGLGGGDVIISAGPVSGMTSDEAREYLAVKPNQWIMVSGWAPRPSLPVPAPGIYPPIYGQGRVARPVYRWYRVVATDNAPEVLDVSGTDYWVRYLTLDGPDWNPNEFCNFNSTSAITPTNLTDTYAVLVDGVVAVFERTMRRQE